MFDEARDRSDLADLEDLEPGLLLAAALSTVDGTELSGHDRIIVLRAHRRMASHYSARAYDDMASVADLLDEGSRDEATEAAAAEIRVALRLTRRAADAELSLALELRERLPMVWESLSSGAIDVPRARTIAHGTSHLPDELARQVVGRLIEQAPDLTTGELGARLRRLCIEADPEEADRRYEAAVDQRRVVMEPDPAGTAHLLGLDLPPHRVAAATKRISHLARRLKSAGEIRTMDQLRADVLLDLITGGAGSPEPGPKGSVDIRTDLDTLAALSESPAELHGYGPVIADIARQVADSQHDAEWRFTVTDPATGAPAATGITRRRPTARQRRAVQTRDPLCVFPGCRMPAAQCDLDHRIPYCEGGATHENQLVPLCRHDHRIRHRNRWQHQPLPGGGHTWTTRLGHTYTTSGRPP